MTATDEEIGAAAQEVIDAAHLHMAFYMMDKADVSLTKLRTQLFFDDEGGPRQVEIETPVDAEKYRAAFAEYSKAQAIEEAKKLLTGTIRPSGDDEIASSPDNGGGS